MRKNNKIGVSVKTFTEMLFQGKKKRIKNFKRSDH